MYTRNNFVADYNPDEEEVRKCRKNLQSSTKIFLNFVSLKKVISIALSATILATKAAGKKTIFLCLNLTT